LELSERLYQNWLLALQTWAAGGDLIRAGTDALRLSRGWRTKRLQRIADRLSQGDINDLPPIELLPDSAMPGAAGAYAESTGSIYLNQDWLENTQESDLLFVLTAEFGHHLDSQLNKGDTPGDEGNTFASLILKNSCNQPFNTEPIKQDHGLIIVNNQWISAELENWTADAGGDNYPNTTDGDENSGDDNLTGGKGNDSISGGAGNDSIKGENGKDLIKGEDGNDSVFGGQQDDSIYGGSGQDLLDGGSNNDLIYGESDNDTLEGRAGNDTLRAGSGQDTLNGQTHNDLLKGRLGNDLLRGHSGNDTLRGGQGDDTLRAGSGQDTLNGQKHNDLLKGRLGNDLLRGQSGNDTLRGGQGDDTLKGGLGADRFQLSKGTDHILDFKPRQGDTLQLPVSISLQFVQNGEHLLLLDPSFNIDTTLHNISLNSLLRSQPELLI